MDPVTHFEMGANDKGRMRKFYETVFGWKTNQLGKEMGEYVLAQTTDTDENRMVTKPGTINGGFYQKTSDPMSHAPSIVIQVDDVDKSIKMVEKAGGRLSGKIEDIPGVGRWASFIDTEGNRVSMMQPNRK